MSTRIQVLTNVFLIAIAANFLKQGFGVIGYTLAAGGADGPFRYTNESPGCQRKQSNDSNPPNTNGGADILRMRPRRFPSYFLLRQVIAEGGVDHPVQPLRRYSGGS